MAIFVSGYMTEDGTFFHDSRDADRYEAKQEFIRLYDVCNWRLTCSDSTDTLTIVVLPENIHNWMAGMSKTQLQHFKAMVRDLKVPLDGVEDNE